MCPEESWVGLLLLNGAPEARKIITLGREPQGKERQIEKSPGGAADFRLRCMPQPSCPDICRRSAADGYLGGWNPGAHAPGYASVAAPRLKALVF